MDANFFDFDPDKLEFDPFEPDITPLEIGEVEIYPRARETSK